jgi:hypothetical protein
VIDGGWSSTEGGARAVLVRPWKRGVRVVAQPGPATLAMFESIADAWKGYDPWGRRRLVAAPLPELVGDAGATIEASDGARVRFGAGAFAEPAYAIVRASAASDAPELRSLGPMYVVDTGAVPIARDSEVTLRARDGASSEHAAMFVRDGERLRYVDTERRAGGSWVARTRTPLAFGLFEDTVPPRVGPPRFEKDGERWTLTFAAKDEGAGIACDEVEVFLDGVPLVHELDDETGDVVAYPRNPVAGVESAFEARVVDRCGNASVRQARVKLP